MSMEYTIDVQLTELGFPDILQTADPSVRHSSCDPPKLPSTSLAIKERLLGTDRPAGKLPSASGADKATPASPCGVVRCSPQLQDPSSGGGGVVRCSPQLQDPSSGGGGVIRCSPQLQDPSFGGGGVVRCSPQLQDPSSGGGGAVRCSPQLQDPSSGGGSTGCLLVVINLEENGEKDGGEEEKSKEGQQEDESDSDDSDVFGLYEEEDEDDEDEEELNDSNHSDDHRCSVCGLQLPSKFKLQDHMNLHTGARPYCCAECGKRFCQIYNYQVHLRTHSTQSSRLHSLQCRICLLSFTSQADLKHHLSHAHPEKQFYECDLCKRVFTCLKVCEEHIWTHRSKINLNCEVCGRTFSSSKSLESHRKRKCHHTLICTDCNQTFTKKNALLKHSFSHLGLLPYTCIRCRRHFRLAKLYRFHKCKPDRIHCMACLREFFSQEDFQQHKKDTGCWGNQETKVDMVRCLECGQRFDTTEELKKHAGAHQRVLKCAVCGKGFRSALLLMSHMGGHAGTSPCLCQTCGLGFPYQQNYDSHLKTCGQKSQRVSAPKKQQPSKRSPSEGQTPRRKPASVKPRAAVAKPAAAVNKPHPVCPTENNGPLAVSQTPPVQQPAVGHQPAPGDVSLGVPLIVPLDLVSGMRPEPECEEPLDLSTRSSDSALSDAPPVPVKGEPLEDGSSWCV